MMNINSFDEMLDFLYPLKRSRGIHFGLENMRICLERLGNPENSFLSVHVAGTKGKGSTAAMLHYILSAAGYSSGLYTSPHLCDFSERFIVNRMKPSKEELLDVFMEAAEATNGGQDPPLTFFEWATVMAFLLFARKKVKVAVLETGMGGRLDATKAAGGRLVLVNMIGLDHQQFLGETTMAIAGEKAGLINRGSTVLSVSQPPDVSDVLRRKSEEAGGKYISVDKYVFSTIHGTGLDGTSFDMAAPGLKLPRLYCSLPGKHQVGNAALAVAGSLFMRDYGITVDEESIYSGLAEIRWPGRLEVFGDKPCVILDGAHNVDSMNVLVDFLRDVFPGGKHKVVFGVMADKDLRGMMRVLSKVEVEIFAAGCGNERSSTPEIIAAAAVDRGLKVAGAYTSVEAALKKAVLSAGDEDSLVVTGSLFAVGEARSLLR